MDQEWVKTFRERMRNFEAGVAPSDNQMAVSIKIRITSGCFHREHSPNAYALIDKALAKISPEGLNLVLEEHESGPELLVFLAITTAGITLAKSLLDLITAIIKARSEGIKKGDHPQEPLELILRRIQRDHEYIEETILRIGHKDPIDPDKISKALNEGLQKHHPNKKRSRT
jgi:hypothetical protein